MSESATLGHQEAPVFTVTRTPARQHSAETAEVQVDLPSGRSARVMIYGPEAATRFEASSPAWVNWSAIGSVSADDALAYAGAIALAASIAPTLAGDLAMADSMADAFSAADET